MFNQKEIEAYHSIHAPKELREAVCTSGAQRQTQSSKGQTMRGGWNRRNVWKYAGTGVAAAAVLLWSVLGGRELLLRQISPTPGIYMEGTLLTQDERTIENQSARAGISMARLATPDLTVEFEVKGMEPAVETEAGEVLWLDDTHFQWIIAEPDQSDDYELLIQEKEQYRMILHFNEENNSWSIHRKG